MFGLCGFLVCAHALGLGPVRFFDSADMAESVFDSLLLEGAVAVIRNASSFWPIADWSCQQFRSQMTGFQVERVYGENDGTFVPLCSDCDAWEQDKRASHNDDVAGPQFAPLYWDVKGDEKSINKIDLLTPAWPFLSRKNLFWKRNAVELWFSPPSAGAKYHIDGHVQMTAVSQLTGTRRWRLAAVPPEPPALVPNHLDSSEYEWDPEIVVTLHPGDLMLFPPGTIHDTLNIGTECAVSVTHQLGSPFPVKFFRSHLRELLHVADTRETWPVIVDLATFGFLKPRATSSAPFFEPHAMFADAYDEASPESFFLFVFTEFVESKKIAGQFGKRTWNEYVAFHDADNDGAVSLGEFMSTAIEWHIVELGIINGFPKKFRPARYFYSQLETMASAEYWSELAELQSHRAKANVTVDTPLVTGEDSLLISEPLTVKPPLPTKMMFTSREEL